MAAGSLSPHVAELVAQADAACERAGDRYTFDSASEALSWFARHLALSSGPSGLRLPQADYGVRVDTSPRPWSGEAPVTAASIGRAIDRLHREQPRWADVVVRAHVHGEQQVMIARLYSVDQSTVSRWIAQGTALLGKWLRDGGILR